MDTETICKYCPWNHKATENDLIITCDTCQSKHCSLFWNCNSFNNRICKLCKKTSCINCIVYCVEDESDIMTHIPCDWIICNLCDKRCIHCATKCSNCNKPICNKHTIDTSCPKCYSIRKVQDSDHSKTVLDS